MTNSEDTPSPLGSEEIFTQVEENLLPGPVRDLWQSVRSELKHGGPESVKTYLQSEFERRKTATKNALNELRTRLQEIE